MSFEEKYANACRTCLANGSTMKSVFSIEKFMEQTMPLCDVLMSLTSVQVHKGDGLPEQVCMKCAQEMNRAFLFRKVCEKSDTFLRHYKQTLLPLPINNVNLTSCFLKVDEESYNEKENVDIPKNEACENVINSNNLTACFLKVDEERYNKEESVDIPKDEVCENEINSNNDNQDDDDKLDIDTIYDEDSAEESEDTNDDDDAYKQKKNNRKKKNEHKKKVYPCKECKTLCLGLGDYRRHMAEAHGQTYKCDTCGKEFRTETVLTRHLLSHTENSENHQIKDVVKKVSKPKQYRNKTGITKKRNLPRTCNICNKTFRFHSNLERHKLIHTGEKPYLCNVCGKGFAQLSYLKIHSFIHTGEKPYKCKMCEKSFAAPGTLMTHIRTHTGERPHVCKICGKDFPQSGYLSAHIRTHTGEKPVECKVCFRRFNQSGRLIIHMRIHSGEKPYNCVECGRSFAVKGTLKKHIRTHTGERPYVCSVCGQAFAQSGTLATHMKVHKPK